MCYVFGRSKLGNSSVKFAGARFKWLLSYRWRNLDVICQRMHQVKAAKGNKVKPKSKLLGQPLFNILILIILVTTVFLFDSYPTAMTLRMVRTLIQQTDA